VSFHSTRGVRIVSPSPGKDYGAEVIDIETGKRIPEVCNIDVFMSPEDIVRAHVELLCSGVDVKAEAEFTYFGFCPKCLERVELTRKSEP
jgi:hypothetical protein